jgi:hypothetical protein
MKPLKPLPIAEAKKLIKEFPLTVCCPIETHWDFLAAINFGEEIPTFYEPTPPVYYATRQADDGRVFLIYALYHRYDPKSRHRHDFEGVCQEVIAGKDNIPAYPKTLSVSHLNLLGCMPTSYAELWCEPGGHALSFRVPQAPRNYMVYENLKPISMDSPLFKRQWEYIRKQFGEWVHLPDEWIDIGLENYVRQKYPVILGERLETTKGLFWHRPDILFELAEKRDMFKR